MTMSVLDICQEALEGCGIDPPSALVSGGDLGAQLLAIANETGRDLLRRGDWQALKVEASFTTAATATQVADITATYPYLKRIIDKSMWNRTQQKRVIGPVSDQAWQRIQATSVAPSTLYWRMRGNAILFPGTPTAGESVYFEYADKRWCSNAAGSSLYTAFQADTDIPRVDDYAFVLGVRWRFRQRKGLEYGEDFRQYEDHVADSLGSDTPKETLNANPCVGYEEYDQQIPDGNWNL